MTKKDYTPEEIIQVIEQIIEIQIAKGYKTGWVYHEMTKRAEKAEANGGSFYGCGMNSDDLAKYAHYIARGDNNIEDFAEMLKAEWEMYQEAVQAYS